MADNALAPPARNTLPQLLKQTAEFPQYGALVEYLTARRRLPMMQYGGVIDPEATAEFQTGAKLPITGQVAMRNSADPNTVVHELTHAAQRQMNFQWSTLASQPDRNLTPDQLRFKQAYEKLVFRPGNSLARTQKAHSKRSPEELLHNG